MSCLEARKCIYDFLNHSLDDGRMEDFLNHVEKCGDCMEELQITHMIYSGAARLDSGDDSLDLSKEFRKTLEQARFHLIREMFWKVGRYSMDTAAFWAVLFVLIMQIRIWIPHILNWVSQNVFIKKVLGL